MNRGYHDPARTATMRHRAWIVTKRGHRTFLAIAAATRRAKTPQAVECEASQSGAKRIARKVSQ